MLHFIIFIVLLAVSITLIMESTQVLKCAALQMDLNIAKQIRNRANISLGIGIGGIIFSAAYLIVMPFLYGVGIIKKKEGFNLRASEYFNGGEY